MRGRRMVVMKIIVTDLREEISKDGKEEIEVSNTERTAVKNNHEERKSKEKGELERV